MDQYVVKSISGSGQNSLVVKTDDERMRKER